MFPFEDSAIGKIPVADTTHLEWNLRNLREHYTGEISVISDTDVSIERICEQYDVEFVEKEQNYLKQIYSLSKDTSATLLLTNGILISNDFTKKLIASLKLGQNVAYISKFDDMVKSIDSVGVSESDGNVEAIYARPRPHYVEGYTAGAFIVNSDVIKQFKYTSKGFDNVNVGQMPDENYYVENALQQAIEAGQKFSVEWVARRVDFTQLNFTYEIVESNQFAVNELLKLEASRDETSYVSSDAIISGKLIIGKNSSIGKNVTIHGDCWIGDNVVVDNGVIIGKNCLINDGSIVNNYAMINDNTIIGTNNKIGFIAEVSGVTFDGVSATHHCEVYGVIGKKVDIAAGVQTAILRFDDELVPVRIGSKKYANNYTSYIAIGNYTRTGVNNVFAPGVRIGSRSAISPGIVVSRDVKHETLLRLEQTLSTDSWGSNKYGW